MEGEKCVRHEIVIIGSLIQAERLDDNAVPAATRIPLQGCTNTRPGIDEKEPNPQKTVTRHWKRRVRLHENEVHMDCLGGSEVREEGTKKREWECWEEEQENTIVMQVVKKGKMHSAQGVANISEVEESSRNWSQSYK